MSRDRRNRIPLALKNANAPWVRAELDALHAEWLAWGEYVKTIEDQPYDQKTQAECFADGVENIRRHDRLREKTLTFLDNNIEGHDFMLCQTEGRPFEDKLARLRVKVPHRIHELEILRDCLPYAAVPEGFWKTQAKTLVQKIATVTPEKAADIAESYLRNPLNN